MHQRHHDPCSFFTSISPDLTISDILRIRMACDLASAGSSEINTGRREFAERISSIITDELHLVDSGLCVLNVLSNFSPNKIDPALVKQQFDEDIGSDYEALVQFGAVEDQHDVDGILRRASWRAWLLIACNRLLVTRSGTLTEESIDRLVRTRLLFFSFLKQAHLNSPRHIKPRLENVWEMTKNGLRCHLSATDL